MLSTNELQIKYKHKMEAIAKSICVAKILGNANEIPTEYVRDLNNVIRIRNLKMPGSGDGSLEELYK